MPDGQRLTQLLEELIHVVVEERGNKQHGIYLQEHNENMIFVLRVFTARVCSVGLVDQKCTKPATVLMPFCVAVSSMVTISSLYGTVSTEGGDTSERSSGHSVHLGHVELLQGGAGGGQGKQTSLSHVVTASH